MNIFDYQDYKSFTNLWIKNQSKAGRGCLRRFAEHLKVNSVVMSQVFSGERDLSLEQAAGLVEILKLNQKEAEYYLLLVQLAKAGNLKLRNFILKQVQTRQNEAQELVERLAHQKTKKLDTNIFYSHWYYSAVRLCASIENLNTTSKLAKHLGLDQSTVETVIDFLLQSGLLINTKNSWQLGPQVTHIAHDNPLVTKHHSNWRIKALQSLDQLRDNDLHYTGPMVLSEKDAVFIKKSLVQLIESTTERAVHSNSEKMKCLIIDWFGVDRVRD